MSSPADAWGPWDDPDDPDDPDAWRDWDATTRAFWVRLATGHPTNQGGETT